MCVRSVVSEGKGGRGKRKEEYRVGRACVNIARTAAQGLCRPSLMAPTTGCSTCPKSCMCVVINVLGFVCDLALNVYPVIREVPVSFIV